MFEAACGASPVSSSKITTPSANASTATVAGLLRNVSGAIHNNLSHAHAHTVNVKVRAHVVLTATAKISHTHTRARANALTPADCVCPSLFDIDKPKSAILHRQSMRVVVGASSRMLLLDRSR
jgi:hypothetical protein